MKSSLFQPQYVPDYANVIKTVTDSVTPFKTKTRKTTESVSVRAGARKQIESVRSSLPALTSALRNFVVLILRTPRLTPALF